MLKNVLPKTLTLSALIASLTGCYVVPTQPSTVHVVQATAPAPVQPLTLSARLYPSNPTASAYGTVAGTITNDLNGRGRFMVNLGGELFQGEATRQSSYSRQGMASATGQRGGYLRCDYTMNSGSLGSGQCELADGARFSLHIGQ